MIKISVLKENKEKLLKILKLIVGFYIIYFIFKFIGIYLSPFIFGYILCLILYPIFKILHNIYKVPKGISGIICIAIFIFLISFIGIGLIGQIVKEGKNFSKDIPYYIENVKITFDGFRDKILRILEILPDGLEKLFLSFYENIQYFLAEILGKGVKNTSVNVIKKIPNFFMIILISIISCFLMLIDKNNIENFILRQIPNKYLDNIRIVKSGIGKAILGYIKAQLIIMSLISTICFLGLSIIKAPYALFIAFIIGIIDAIPVFGSGFILWPWSLYNIIIKNYSMSIGIMIIYLVIIISRQFIEPKILGKQIGVHPLATLMSIYIGIKVFGLFGFIIGPSIMVIIKALQNENLLPKWR